MLRIRHPIKFLLNTSSMLKRLFFIVSILNIVIFVQGEGIYNLVAPGTIHPYFKYNVALSVYRADGPCEIEISITGKTFNTSQIINMQPMTLKNVEFETQNLEKDDYKLSVKGLSGITIENSTNLNFDPNDPLVFIQIDKPVYAPGELVQFRVIFIDEYTYPEELKAIMYIRILDDAFRPIQIWRNINLTYGVYTGNFQLSNASLNTQWNIDVTDGKKRLQIKSFLIFNYELPKFKVTVDVRSPFALTDDVVPVNIKAIYTFGKPVKGKFELTVQTYHEGETFATKKSSSIKGKTHIDLDIKRDLPKLELFNSQAYIDYSIYVTIEESLTGEKQQGRAYFRLEKQNIILRAITPPKTFRPGKLIKYMVEATKLDGSPIRDDNNPVELSVNELKFYSQLNENGIATFRFALPDIPFADIACAYLDKREDFYSIRAVINETSPPPGRFELKVKTEAPELRKDLLIKVKWSEPIDHIIYIVTGRGNIIKAERIDIRKGRKSLTIKIKPTLEMIPVTKILVQYIHNDNLRFEETNFYFKQDFQNTLNISTIAQASPGDDVEFLISTDPNSYVGILGVDLSVTLLSDGYDFKKQEIFHELERIKTATPPLRGKGRYPGKMSGLVTLTNAHFPFFFPYEYAQVDAINPSRYERRLFPQTWIFENFNVTNQTQFKFTKKIPDTITSWVISGFSMNSKTGIGLTEDATKIQVLKPFFISINLPNSVKKGEIISIPILIFNYMNETIDAEIIMDNLDNEFEFVEASNEIEESTIAETKRIKRAASIPSDTVDSVSFMIKPKTVGVITIKVTGLTALAGDIVHRQLKVEPDGVKQHKNTAFFINLNERNDLEETIDVDVPSNAVPDSEHIQFSAIGDLVGLSIKYIENLVRTPVGYGEQNMIHFVPSILVLKYLKTIDLKMSNVTRAAIETLKIGFQLELRYGHDDGSFSAYGKSDRSGALYGSDGQTPRSGSTWLTAYVIRSFLQASDFIEIDPTIVVPSLRFLASKQTTNGNFAEYGDLFEFPHLNDASLTAFVLLAFLEKEQVRQQTTTLIDKGIDFLLKNFYETDDIYSASITSLILQKAKHPLANEILKKLKAVAKNESALTWWSSDSKKQKKNKAYATLKSSDIEVTAYILQAMLENGPAEDALPIIKWLAMQRNSNGGFTSTQDTVVGLQALIKFAEKTGLKRSGAVNINYVCEGNEVDNEGTITITPESSMVLNIHELPKRTRRVRFAANGNSSSLVQLSYSFHTIDSEPEQDFRLDIKVRENTPPKKLLIDICAKFTPRDSASDDKKTNMLVIEAALPSGFTTTREKLDKIRDFRNVIFTETMKSDTIAIIYLHSLEVGEEKCILIEAFKEHDVAKQKPTPVVIYDYYNKERRATEYYAFNTSLCDICEGEDCGKECKKDEITTIASKISSSQESDDDDESESESEEDEE